MKLLDIYKYLEQLPEGAVPARGLFILASTVLETDLKPMMGWSYSDLLSDDWVFIPESQLSRVMRSSVDQDISTFKSFVDEYGLKTLEQIMEITESIASKKPIKDYNLRDALIKHIYDSSKDKYDLPWDDLMSYEREEVWNRLGWSNTDNMEVPRELTEEEKSLNPEVMYRKAVYKALTFKEAVFQSLIPDILSALKDRSVFLDVDEYVPYKIIMVGTRQNDKK